MTTEEITGKAIAALVIEKFALKEMDEGDLDLLWGEDRLLAVYADGSIVFGETRHESHTMRTYKAENVYFDGQPLVERKYAITESMANGGFERDPEVTVHMENVTFYRQI